MNVQIANLFERPRRHIQWARDAIVDLGRDFDAYIENCSHRRFIERDGTSDWYVEKFRIDTPIPSSFCRRTTEALNNVKNAFDMAVYAACCAVGRKPKGDVHFPWRENPIDLKRRLENSKSNIPQELWTVIQSHEPYYTSTSYTGGNDLIRELAKLANQKHTIGLEAVVNCSSYSFGGTLRAGGVHGSVIMPTPRWDDDRNEMVLWIGNSPNGSELDFKFAVHIAINTPSIHRKYEVFSAIEAFSNKAESVCDDLYAECMRIASI